MVATLGNGLRRDVSRNTYDIGLTMPRHRQRIYELYWVEKLPQTAIAQQLHLAQSTVCQHIDGIRRTYATAGVHLPRPKTTPRPKALVRRKYVTPGVVEIDVAALVNQLRQLGKTRSGTVSEGILLGTVLMAIDDDTVQDAIGRLVRPAAGGGKRV